MRRILNDRIGRTVVVSLGSVDVRGVLAWSTRNTIGVADAAWVAADRRPTPVKGELIIPFSRVLFVQDMGDGDG